MSGNDIALRFVVTRKVKARTRCSYLYTLRAFDEFVLDRTRGEGATVATLRTWLQREVERSPLPSVIRRMGLIADYVEWRKAVPADSHPLVELRAQHGRPLAPIVRALLADDHESALERLKPLPDWGSVLGPTMKEHVERMQTLGHRYDVRLADLKRFDRFLQCRRDLAGSSLTQMLDAWRDEGSSARHQLVAQQCEQILAKALRRKDPTVRIPPTVAGLYRQVAKQERRPYVFTEDEVRRLFDAARAFPSPKKASLRPVALHAMVALAYCTGMRVGEVASLTLGDLDLQAGVIEIRETKFFKSRRLPMAPEALRVLRNYVEARRATGAPTVPGAQMWWSPLRRGGYCCGAIQEYLNAVMRNAGLKPDRGAQGPRIHDLRHTFVAHRMMQWYRDGVEPQPLLPYLATYLGHKDIRSTLNYLQIAPELLQQASERHRHHNAGVLGSTGGQP